MPCRDSLNDRSKSDNNLVSGFPKHVSDRSKFIKLKFIWCHQINCGIRWHTRRHKDRLCFVVGRQWLWLQYIIMTIKISLTKIIVVTELFMKNLCNTEYSEKSNWSPQCKNAASGMLCSRMTTHIPATNARSQKRNATITTTNAFKFLRLWLSLIKFTCGLFTLRSTQWMSAFPQELSIVRWVDLTRVPFLFDR